jgi:hypothetical protein
VDFKLGHYPLSARLFPARPILIDYVKLHCRRVAQLVRALP